MINLIFAVKPLADEKSGLLFALAGAILVTIDPLALRIDGYIASNSTLVSLALSSVVGTAYMYFNGKNTIEYRLYFMIFYQSLLMFLLSSFFAVISSGGHATFFSVDAVWGCFGFLSPTAFSSLIVLQGVMSGFFGTWGQLLCLFFHAPVITHSCLLIVPFLQEGIAFAWGIDT